MPKIAAAIAAILFFTSLYANAATAAPSSCIIILSGAGGGIDKTMFNASTLVPAAAIKQVFNVANHGKITGAIDANEAYGYGMGALGHDERSVVGTEMGHILFISPTEPTLYLSVSNGAITHVSNYLDPVIRKPVTIAASAKGTHSIKRDDELTIVHELPGARKTLKLTSTREGVIAVFPQVIQRFTDLGTDEGRIKVAELAHAEKEFLLADTCELNGRTAVVDGQSIKLVDSKGDQTTIATLDASQKIQSLKLSPEGRRLAVKTTEQILLLLIHDDGQIDADAIDSTGMIGAMKWSAGADHLAIDNFDSVTIINVLNRSGKEIHTALTGAMPHQRLTWLSADGMLATISALPVKKAKPATTIVEVGAKAEQKKPVGQWIVQFWDADTGENISNLRAGIPMLNELETPPRLVNVSGRLHFGDLQFSLLAEDGRMLAVHQTLKGATPTSKTLILPK